MIVDFAAECHSLTITANRGVCVQESAALADRLIQDQVIRAQEAEESYALKNELSVLRQQHQEAQRKLEEADVLIAEIKRRVRHPVKLQPSALCASSLSASIRGT